MIKALLILLAAAALGLVLALSRLDTVTTQRDTARGDAEISQARTESLRATLRLNRELLTDRDALDIQSSRELKNAQEEITGLRDAVRAGERRLSVAARCPGLRTAVSAGTASMDDASPRAELDPEAADRVLRITGDGDEGLIALRGLQDYVIQVCGRAFSPATSSRTGLPAAGSATSSDGAGRAR